ncbi:unnamed protein product [Coffea canephora]|uniref:FAD dependent oxidoreductase domain-containing protein n=1 Tax=Coffea canephora TaxID=49390 RepID=A0A068UW09_COFCA|nr:unnamed protein product [Coffea canephora]
MENCSEISGVIVVGASIMGSSTASQLAKSGKQTLLFEQFDFLPHRGCSHGESRTTPLHLWHSISGVPRTDQNSSARWPPLQARKRTWAASPAALNALKEWIQSKFGDFIDSSGPVLRQSCMYSMTPDEDFVIDFLVGEFGKDVVVGGGFSGHGFKMAPVIGRILADLAIDMHTKDVELKHLSIERFEGNSEGNPEDFGH